MYWYLCSASDGSVASKHMRNAPLHHLFVMEKLVRQTSTANKYNDHRRLHSYTALAARGFIESWRDVTTNQRSLFGHVILLYFLRLFEALSHLQNLQSYLFGICVF